MTTVVQDVFDAQTLKSLLDTYFDTNNVNMRVADYQMPDSGQFMVIVVESEDEDTEDTGDDSISLSPREVEVIYLIARGYSNKQISWMLKISPATVATYVRRALTKYNANSRAELVFYAMKASIIE